MESKSLTNELIDTFNPKPDSPSASAFVQCCSNLKLKAFKAIFYGLTSSFS